MPEVFDLQPCDSEETADHLFAHGLYLEDIWEVLDVNRWLIFRDDDGRPDSRRKLIGPNRRDVLITTIIQAPEQGEQYPCIVTAYLTETAKDLDLYSSGEGTRYV